MSRLLHRIAPRRAQPHHPGSARPPRGPPGGERRPPGPAAPGPQEARPLRAVEDGEAVELAPGRRRGRRAKSGAAVAEPEATLPEPPRCPRCGAAMAPEQDWCLECGAAATTRVLRPPGWR